jgi:hypothetical protein
MKNIISMAKKFADDGSGDVREKVIVLLAKIQARVYEGTLKKELQDLKPEKIVKVNTLA